MCPDVRDGTERFKLALERIKAGESEMEEVQLSTGRVRLTPDESAPTGVRIEPLEGESGEVAMPKMDPERREAMERMHQATSRIQSGESDFEEIISPEGETVRISRDPDIPEAIILEAGEGKMTMRTIPFQPTPTRPPHYPDDLPFLPDCPSGLTETGGGETRSLNWFFAADPESQFREIAAQLASLGWEGGEETQVSHPMGRVRMMGFRKGGRARMVRVTQFGDKTMINLTEMPEGG